MKAYRFILFALLLVLAACTQAPSPAAPPEDETLTSLGVLPGASGLVYFIRHDPQVAKPYSVISFDQATNIQKSLFSSDREIQLVAGTLTGSTVIVSMRETTSSSSDFEIFRISNNAATQQTTNSFDDIHVSITRVLGSGFLTSYKMAWETQVFCILPCFTKRAIQVRRVSLLSPPSDSFVTGGSGDLTQPSISGNGACVAFVRKSGNTKRVELYKFSNNSFTVIASSSSVAINFSDPSPSDDCTKVAYLKRTGIFPQTYSIMLNALTIVSGVPFAHPHLTADGKWLTYAQQVNNAFRIKTRNLLTNLETDATMPASPVNTRAPFWQKANP
jgi:hypothetical protein